MTALSEADRELLAEAAAAVVRRRLAVPAMMFLEMSTPMNVVTASMLHVLQPIWHAALPGKRIDRLAALLERRDTIPALIEAIDAAEADRRDAERAERPPRARRWPWRRARPTTPETTVEAAAGGADPERPEDRPT